MEEEREDEDPENDKHFKPKILWKIWWRYLFVGGIKVKKE